MALPTVEKTWQYNVNQTPANNPSAVLYAMKASLTGFASNPWQVVSSSNCTNYGDADYWSSAADVRYAVTPGPKYSWIVLKQPAISSNFQVLITARTTAGGWDEAMNFRISPSVGFTGGTLTTFPSASDQILETSYSRSGGTYNPVYDYSSAGWPPVSYHAMMSSDGKCTRSFACGLGIAAHILFIDVPKDPITLKI